MNKTLMFALAILAGYVLARYFPQPAKAIGLP
jgi:hypothetical protein